MRQSQETQRESSNLGVVRRQSSCCLGTLAVNATVAARPGTEA